MQAMVKVGMGRMGRMGMKFLEERKEWRLYVNGLISCGRSEEDVKVMVGSFVEV